MRLAELVPLYDDESVVSEGLRSCEHIVVSSAATLIHFPHGRAVTPPDPDDSGDSDTQE
jgi:hypothetical protein